MIRLLGDSSISIETRTLLLGYRWLVLGSVLIVAAISDVMSGLTRWVVLAPIGASVVVTVALWVRNRAPMLSLLEVTAGVLLVSVSRSPESPFVAYLTIPIVHVALLGAAPELAIAVVAAVGGLAIATSAAGGIGQFGYAIVSEAMVLAAMAALIWLVNASRPVGRGASGGSPSSPLSDDDRGLLEHLASGRTYSQIAEMMDVSVETVKVRVARLYRRLGARNRIEAVDMGIGRSRSGRSPPSR